MPLPKNKEEWKDFALDIKDQAIYDSPYPLSTLIQLSGLHPGYNREMKSLVTTGGYSKPMQQTMKAKQMEAEEQALANGVLTQRLGQDLKHMGHRLAKRINPNYADLNHFESGMLSPPNKNAVPLAMPNGHMSPYELDKYRIIANDIRKERGY